jgi:hypothetical protein
MLAVLPILGYINLHGALQNVTNGAKIMQGENRNDVKFGFTPQAENWNGRLAMIGFIAAVITEYVTGLFCNPRQSHSFHWAFLQELPVS